MIFHSYVSLPEGSAWFPAGTPWNTWICVRSLWHLAIHSSIAGTAFVDGHVTHSDGPVAIGLSAHPRVWFLNHLTCGSYKCYIPMFNPIKSYIYIPILQNIEHGDIPGISPRCLIIFIWTPQRSTSNLGEVQLSLPKPEAETPNCCPAPLAEIAIICSCIIYRIVT